jgi:hypothetical protein
MTTQTIDPTILDRLKAVSANIRALTPDMNINEELDNLDAIVAELTPPPAEDPTPGKPDWAAAGCCGGYVTAEAHGPGIETWPGTSDQFWCTGWDPDAQPAEEPAADSQAS